jgi:hypothetical protein
MCLVLCRKLSHGIALTRKSSLDVDEDVPDNAQVEYDNEGFRKLRYKRFTKKSYEKLLVREENDRKEEKERKDRQEVPLLTTACTC